MISNNKLTSSSLLLQIHIHKGCKVGGISGIFCFRTVAAMYDPVLRTSGNLFCNISVAWDIAMCNFTGIIHILEI